MFKLCKPNYIILIKSFSVWICVLVYVSLFYWFPQYSNGNVLYVLLFVAGLCIAGGVCVIMAFLNMFQVLTGFLSSMLLTGLCFGGAIAGVSYGWIIEYYKQKYSIVAFIMFILASVCLFLSIVMFIGHRAWSKIKID